MLSKKSGSSIFVFTLISIFATTALGCGFDEEVEGSHEDDASESHQGIVDTVIIDGLAYHADEVSELTDGFVHYAVTREANADGVILGFLDDASFEEFRAGYLASLESAPGSLEAALFQRKVSKFYNDTGFGDKLLELSPGASVRDLATNACNCRNRIESVKAARKNSAGTMLYDFEEFGGDDLWIAPGAEITDLATRSHNGSSWANDANSLEVL